MEQIPIPDEAAEDSGGQEELAYGKYSLTESEKAEIRKKAQEAGRDPEEAVRMEEEKMKAATARLREKQAREAIERLERDLKNT
jgi:hypothetical protein